MWLSPSTDIRDAILAIGELRLDHPDVVADRPSDQSGDPDQQRHCQRRIAAEFPCEQRCRYQKAAADDRRQRG